MSTAAPTGHRLAVDERVDRALRDVEQLDALLRALVARAAAGEDRAVLAAAAGHAIAAVRRDAPLAATQAALMAYVQAAGAVRILLERPAMPLRTGGERIAGRSATLLDHALRTVDDGARQAIRAASADDVVDRQLDAVTGHVAARTGRRWPLRAYARMIVTTTVRRATSAGTADALLAAGRPEVTISAHGTTHPFCAKLEGQTLPADANLPPYHPGCTHTAIPAGFTADDHAAALEAAGRGGR